MHCFQWFLPLVLLPRPASSPVFLGAYLIAHVLEHRPCLYCSSMFIVLAIAAAYIQGAAWIAVDQPPYALQFDHWTAAAAAALAPLAASPT